MPRNTNAMRVGRDSRGLTSNNSPPDHEFSEEGVPTESAWMVRRPSQCQRR